MYATTILPISQTATWVMREICFRLRR